MPLLVMIQNDALKPCFSSTGVALRTLFQPSSKVSTTAFAGSVISPFMKRASSSMPTVANPSSASSCICSVKFCSEITVSPSALKSVTTSW